MMTEIRVTLETVTPLFLGGANPCGEPELRAASVRGALRFWLRALLGGVLGDSDPGLNELRRAEAAVFGSTDTGASPVVVKLTGDIQPSQDYPILPHNPAKACIKGVNPGKLLSLTLAPRPPHHSLPDVGLGAMVAWILLGGLGKRSRRGFGSFVLHSAPSEFPLQPSDYEADAQDFCQRLRHLVERAISDTCAFVHTLVPNCASISISNPPRFPMLHAQHTKVLFCKEAFQSWEVAMKELWKVLRSNDYRNNSVFGFAGSAGRQASPLHLRIVRVNGTYHLLVTAFRVHFRGDQPDWKVMQGFLERCRSQWKGEWIFGGNTQW